MKKWIVAIVTIALLAAGLVPAMAAGADFTAVSLPAEENITEQVFQITNNGAAASLVVFCSGKVNETLDFAAGETKKVTVSDPGLSGFTLYVGEKDNDSNYKYIASANSYLVYVNYVDGSGTKLYGTTETMTSAVTSVAHTAPDTLTAGGKQYRRVTRATQGIGKNTSATLAERTLTFTYEEVVAAAYDVTVSYVDAASSAVVKTEMKTIPVNGSVTLTPLAGFTEDGKQYELAAGQTTVVHDYADTQRSYIYYVNRVASDPTSPYNITVVYADAADGKGFKTQILTVGVGATVTVDVPASFIRADGTRFVRANGQPVQIVHKANNSTRLYTVLFNEDTTVPTRPYDITIRLADAATGSILRSETRTVALNGSVSYTAPASFTENGKSYLIASGQSRFVNHKFGGRTLIYTVYYDEEGADPAQTYEITVSLLLNRDSTVLQSWKVTVPVRGSVTVTVPATYTYNGTTLVLGNSQETQTVHDYESARRSYSFFYMDPADNESFVIPVPNPQPGDNTGNTGDNTTGDNTGDTTGDNTGDGETVIPDETTPATEGETTQPTASPDGEIIPDETTPATQGSGSTVNGNLGWWLGGGALLLAAAAALLTALLTKKKAQ